MLSRKQEASLADRTYIHNIFRKSDYVYIFLIKGGLSKIYMGLRELKFISVHTHYINRIMKHSTNYSLIEVNDGIGVSRENPQGVGFLFTTYCCG